MIIIGDMYIPFEYFYTIKTKDDISNTKPNSVVLCDFDKEILSYCFQNEIRYCVKIKDLTEAVISNSLGATYVIVDKNLAKSAQKTAENYLFDTKILVEIEEEKEIEELVNIGIDAVIYSKLAVK